jgi:cytochrome c oxidase subunit I
MTTIAPPTDIATPPPGDNYLNHEKGLASWLVTLDHKRIGLVYAVFVVAAFALGGFFALMIRTELFTPGATFTFGGDPNSMAVQQRTWDFYNQMFTLHGAVMVFMFIIPSIPAILGNFILPMMLGAKDVAFPRLNLMSLYCYMGGGIFFVWVLLSGILHTVTGWTIPGGFGLDTGWTFYTPYSTQTNTAVVAATFGAFLLGFSSILTGVNFIATIHLLRPKGMGWFQMPLFLWALYATSVIQILATPVLAITLLLLIAERVLRVGIFDPELGGDPVLYQHFFWFYSHPAVYIMILPGMGVVSELISVHCRKHIFGYSFIAFSSLAIALLGFLVWGHHMFTSGQSSLTNAVFSIITMIIAVPSAVKVFNWLSTLFRSSINFNAPMLYAMEFIGLFTVGGLTGLFLAAISMDIHFQDTYFVVAHFHYVMVGSTLTAFLGGTYHWWPKITGKMYNDFVAKIASFIFYAGFNITFFIQFLAGSHGMPRRYASYPEEFTHYHQISTIGAYIMASGLILALINLIMSLKNGKKAPANPWGANSLEWYSPSPPPYDNFPVTPPVSDPYDFSKWKYEAATDSYRPLKPGETPDIKPLEGHDGLVPGGISKH